MIDLEIKKFYNDVKDSSWPNIESYADYVQLPAHIKKECSTLHGFNTYKKQICDLDHWLSKTSSICVYENLAFVPVTKCAYYYYTTIFTDLGWKKVKLEEVDVENTKFFGTIMHPLQRRLKGITQWLVECYRTEPIKAKATNPWVIEPTNIDWDQLNKDLSLGYLKKIIQSLGCGDLHSRPYSITFGSLLSKVAWIPMDILSDNDVKKVMMQFFKRNGHSVLLPLNDQRLHVSDANQLNVYQIVKDTFLENPTSMYDFYKLYSNDLDFYYNLLDIFQPDWQHLKTS